MIRSMYRRCFVSALAVATIAAALRAENSAPSSHLVFDDRFDGDIIINEVRVPGGGEATYTYYEALGWRGKGAGYAGIQAHPKAHLYIFSIWDHKEHRAPIKAVYRGPKTKTVGFGGEGTGLKSWNFELGWKPDVWYTLVARTWPVGDHTHYGFWVRASDTGKWTHLVTMDVAVETIFRGGTDAFIEDWSSTGARPRTTHLRGGWKRKTDGTWHAFHRARYSVNAWDLERGKRSYNFRRSWNGGVARDETGEYWFMTSGGAKTTPTTKNPSAHSIERTATAPEFKTIAIRKASATFDEAGSLKVEWEVNETTAPPFSYDVKLFANRAGDGEPLARTSGRVPHARSATLDVPALKIEDGKCFVRIECTDILDRLSKPVVVSPVRGGDDQ